MKRTLLLLAILWAVVPAHAQQVQGMVITKTALGAAGVYTSNWFDATVTGAHFVVANAYTDQASAASGFIIQGADDIIPGPTNTNLNTTLTSTTVVASTYTSISVNLTTRFYRIKLTNGGTPQTALQIDIITYAAPRFTSGTVTVSGTVTNTPAAGIPTVTATGTLTAVNTSVQLAVGQSQFTTIYYAAGSGTYTITPMWSVGWAGTTLPTVLDASWIAVASTTVPGCIAVGAGASTTFTQANATQSIVCQVPPGMQFFQAKVTACAGCSVVPFLTANNSGAPMATTTGATGLFDYRVPAGLIGGGAPPQTLAGTAFMPNNSGSANVQGGAEMRYNATTNEQMRNNLPSATVGITCSACTSTQTGTDQVNHNFQGVKCVYDATTVTGSGSFTLSIQGKDAVSGKYFTLLQGAAVSTVSTNVYTVHPRITATANQASADILPRDWRVLLTYNSGTNQTATVGCALVQ